MSLPPLPTGHRRIGMAGVDELTVDAKNQLHWKGGRLKTEIRLTRLQELLGGLVVLSTVLASIAAILAAYVDLTETNPPPVVYVNIPSSRQGNPTTDKIAYVTFPSGSATISRAQRADLREKFFGYASCIKNIAVFGYSSSAKRAKGGDEYNLDLANRRAASVAAEISRITGIVPSIRRWAAAEDMVMSRHKRVPLTPIERALSLKAQNQRAEVVWNEGSCPATS